MLVRKDGTVLGTLGGGCLEAEVTSRALMAMKDGFPVTAHFDLTGKDPAPGGLAGGGGGLVCGGRVLVYIEPVVPGPDLIILGAGHVGRALAAAGVFAGFRVTVIDDRQEFANSRNIPQAQETAVRDFADPLSGRPIGENSYIVIATRGHNHDLDAVKAALRTDASFIALVGSRRKKAIFARQLKVAGFKAADIERVASPAGLPIGSQTPEEIAISITAQLIQKRSQRTEPKECGCQKTGTEAEGR